jgi:hypothetical protein
MRDMAGRTAIAVDGMDRPATDGVIAFAVGTVEPRAPRRPVIGLAIAFVTALLTMGALGPRPAPIAAPAPLAAAEAADALNERIRVEAPAGPVDGPLAWWELPQMALWVDPATGRSMQAAADQREHPRLADHRARDL